MVTCQNCGHQWTPRSLNRTVTCSQCGRKVKQDEPTLSVLARKVPLNTECDVCGVVTKTMNACRLGGEAMFVCNKCLDQIGAEKPK